MRRDPKHPPARDDGPVDLSNVPPDALSIILSYAIPVNAMHRFEFAGVISRICRSWRDVAHDILQPAPFELEDYLEYYPLVGADRDSMDCRLSLLESMVCHPAKRDLVSEFCISRDGVRKDFGDIRSSESILKTLRVLLTMEGSFKNSTHLCINLDASVQEMRENSIFYARETNVPLLNQRTIGKLAKAFPSLFELELGHCIDREIFHSGKSFISFFRSLKLPLKHLSLCKIIGLEEYHVALILRVVGESLTSLEITGGSVGDGWMISGRSGGTESMYNEIASQCKCLETLSLSKLRFYYSYCHLEIVFRSVTNLKELRMKENEYYEYVGETELRGSDAEFYFQNFFMRYGKTLETFSFDFRSPINTGEVVRNLMKLQKSANEAVDSSGTSNEEGIKLHSIEVMDMLDGDICYVVRRGGVRNICLTDLEDITLHESALENIREQYSDTYGNALLPLSLTIRLGYNIYEVKHKNGRVYFQQLVPEED